MIQLKSVTEQGLLGPRDPAVIHMANPKSYYETWRQARWSKLNEFLGPDWSWNGKTVLEVGAGFGLVGKMCQDAGAIVTYTEVREKFINHILQHANGPVYHHDHNLPWDLGQVFDLVIHWGLLYHLENWEQDLIIAIHHGKLLSLETYVIDSNDPYLIKEIDEPRYHDMGITGKTRHASWAAIEKVLNENAKSFKYHPDKMLNVEVPMVPVLYYNWEPGSKEPGERRRFYMVECL